MTDHADLIERLEKAYISLCYSLCFGLAAEADLVAEAAYAIEVLVKERDEALAECEEQARLLGMSGSREAALVASNAEVERDLAALRKQIDELQPKAWLYTADEGRSTPFASTRPPECQDSNAMSENAVIVDRLYSLEGIKK